MISPGFKNARFAALAEQMSAIVRAAEAEGRNLTPEEQGAFDALDAEGKQLAPFARVEALEAPAPRVVQPEMSAMYQGTPSGTGAPASGRPSVTGGELVAHGHGNGGFARGPGEFFASVVNAAHGRVDQRLRPYNSVSSFDSETIPGDGGYALPTQFAAGILSAVRPEASFLNAMRTVYTSTNLLRVPTDEDTPWSTTAITAAKTAEGATITASKAAIKKVDVVIHKISSLVHVSDEMLQDLPFVGSYVQRKMGEKIRWKMENYVMNGTGLDEPLGILNAPSLLALSDAASTATTIGAVDIFAMKAACLIGEGCFWVVNPTVLPAIWALKTDATVGYPLFTPDMTKAPEGMLLGAPVYRSEACPLLNTTGDIVLVCPDGYILAMASSGLQAATTIGFAFDQGLQSFRATLRMGGAAVLSAKVERAKSTGSTFASHVIALTGSRS